jgi:hypothetical protein
MLYNMDILLEIFGNYLEFCGVIQHSAIFGCEHPKRQQKHVF